MSPLAHLTPPLMKSQSVLKPRTKRQIEKKKNVPFLSSVYFQPSWSEIKVTWRKESTTVWGIRKALLWSVSSCDGCVPLVYWRPRSAALLWLSGCSEITLWIVAAESLIKQCNLMYIINIMFLRWAVWILLFLGDGRHYKHIISIS